MERSLGQIAERMLRASPWLAAAAICGAASALAGDKLPQPQALDKACAQSEESCARALRERTLRIETPDSHGSGFVLWSTPKEMFILTAAHVAEGDHGGLAHGLRVVGATQDSVPGLEADVAEGCLFRRDTYGDLAVLRAPNPTGRVFAKVEVAPDAYRGDSVFVSSYRDTEPKLERFALQGFDSDRSDVVLKGLVKTGYSGSGIVTPAGKLLGVVYAFETARSQTRGTYRIEDLLKVDFEYLRSKQSVFTPYTCLAAF